MPRYFGLRSLGRQLRKAMPGSDWKTFKKRQFVAGFVEGQAKRKAPGLTGSSETWRVSGKTVKSALEELAKGRESSISPQQQIKAGDVEKIEKALHLEGPAQPQRPAIPTQTPKPSTPAPKSPPPHLQGPMK